MDVFFTGLLYVLVGAAFLLAGYRFFRILIPIWGFFVGFEFGAQGVAAIAGTGFLATSASLVGGLIMGVLLAVLAYLFYWVAVVLLGAGVGADLGSGLMQAFGIHNGGALWLAGFAGAVIAAGLIIVFNMPKLLLIIISAFGGASALIGGVLLWFGTIKLDYLGHGSINAAIKDSWWWGLVWVILAIAGIAYQSISAAAYTLEPYPDRI